MGRRVVALGAAVAGILILAAPAGAAVPVHATGWNAEDGPMPAMEEHPGGPGHLPAGSRTSISSASCRLTSVEGGIADVGAFGDYAYLNAFSPECSPTAALGRACTSSTSAIRPTRGRSASSPRTRTASWGRESTVVRADTPFFRGDILIHNNETCNATKFAPSGASLWDVTDPLSPRPLSLNFGDPSPVDNQTYHTTHSAQLFVQRGVLGGKDRVIATLQDNQDLADVDIFDVSNPRSPVMLSEHGLESWPGAQGSYANGDTVFHHDMQHKRIDGHDYLLVSYWDAGQVLLNIDDPANPLFVTDSDYRFPDPLMPQFEIPEGNSH